MPTASVADSLFRLIVFASNSRKITFTFLNFAMRLNISSLLEDTESQ